MQSSSRSYLPNLDHLRAFAIFEVFVFHSHPSPGCPDHCTMTDDISSVPFLSLLAQGFSGVSLFMCISGYIFARLTDGQRVNISKFWLNRILRLFPLLLAVGALCLCVPGLYPWQETTLEPLREGHYLDALYTLAHPQGAWSVYIEIQYYLLFPLLLFIIRKTGCAPVVIAGLVITLSWRIFQWIETGSVQDIAYYTLWGRADQFLLGTAAFFLEKKLTALSPRDSIILPALGTAGAFGIVMFYEWLNLRGGFYHDGGLPSPDPLWIILPTVDGLCYAAVIMAYMQLRIAPLPGKILSSVGKWSYSIYLLHVYLINLIFPVAFPFLSAHLGVASISLHGRIAFDLLVAFPVTAGCAALTYRFIELPFLRLRLPYLRPIEADPS